MSHIHRTMLKDRLAASLPSSGRIMRSDSFKKSRLRNFEPTIWSEYFAMKEDVVLDDERTFQIYRSKKPEKQGPLLLLLHGGGYSGLTWAHFCLEITNMIHCECLSLDLRGHGNSRTTNDEDLSMETMVKDIGDVMTKLYPEQMPPVYVIGHSMGGAIAVNLVKSELINGVIGITVIDVVEGTALEALASMQSFLRSRPKHFTSIRNAIEWCIRSGQIRNVESAKVSVPGQIINCFTKQLAANELPIINTKSAEQEEDEDDSDANSKNSQEKFTKFVHPLSISEDDEDDEISGKCNTNRDEDSGLENEQDTASSTKSGDKNTSTTTSCTTNNNSNRYTWRIDLSKSEKYWIGWFSGLSEKFLNLRLPKQLLLASIDGLDKTLTVGQMQGRFQMQVLSRCGHAIHEDRPHEVAEVLSSYLIRNRCAEAAGEFRCHLPAC